MKNIKTSVTLLLLCIFIFFITGRTYSSLASTTNVLTEAPLADWNILINNTNITSTYDNVVSLKNIDWISNHSIKYNAAPGSTGKVKIIINPTTTKVAIRYDLTITDSTVDENKILTLLSLEIDNGELVKTGPNTYTKIISLAEIEESLKDTITMEVKWINDESNNDRDTNIANGVLTPDYLGLHFVATQYNGEEIIKYNE